MFSYGLYLFSSIPSISDIPTTKTPSVYSFTPATLPTGITVVFGNTDTFMFFTNILSNKFNFNVFVLVVFVAPHIC